MIATSVNGRPARDYVADYLLAGLSIVPIRGDKSKAPAIDGWKRYQTKAPTLAEANQFWLADNIGIGIVHGRASGNTEAIDIDTAELFPPFVVEVERLAPGLIDRLTFIKTPRPGYHVVYKCSEIGSPQKLAQRPDPTPERPNQRKTLIETKGEGGYTLAPGSPGCCHETGGLYEHVDGPPLTELTTITPDEREILFRVARSFNEIFDETPTTASKPQGERADGLSPGDDFNRRATWEEILEPNGWEFSHDKYWRRPGKANGWSATVGCQSQHGTELFCCFSDNAHPLTGANGRSPCTAYSKFALYAVLNHGGDYSAAASRLRTEGYGDQRRERVSDGGDRYTTEPPKPSPVKLPPIERIGLGRLIDENPVLNEPIIEGLLRRMETMNVIAPPKVGKSWFAYYIMLCTVTGRAIFGRYAVKRGRVLLVDLELHKSLIASRLQTVAREMEIAPDDYVGMIDVVALRGNWKSMPELLAAFADIQHGEYSIIVIDSRYRLSTVDENANGEGTQLYNMIDRLAEITGAAIIVIHHMSKGDQSNKRLTDLGAGAGAQSRAADVHAALREHETDGVFVLEAVVRSFAPFEPLAIRWQFPLWVADEWADPSKLAGRLAPNDERQQAKDKEGRDAIVKALLAGPLTVNDICKKAGMGKQRFNRLIGLLEENDQVSTTNIKIAHNDAVQYQLNDPDLEGGPESRTTSPDHQTA